MLKKPILTLFYLIFSSIIYIPIPAQADVKIIFDPETFLRGSGKPINEIRGFSLASSCESSTLYILNGDGTGNKNKRSAGAIIKLNGFTIVSTGQFNKNVTNITAPVQIVNQNRLEVELRSTPGSQVTIHIECITTGTPNSPPTANAGPDQTVNLGAVVTLDGSGSADPEGDTVTYQWTITSAPGGSTASLSSPASVTQP